MKLQIASIEAPEFVHAEYPFSSEEIYGRTGYRPEYETIADQTFQGKRLIVDNHQFQNCKFLSCNLVYAGGLYGFQNCEFDDATALSLTGSAARANALWKAIREHPERSAGPF